MNKVDTKAKVLDIAMNLNRLGNWAADDYDAKKERIKTFLGNTTFYIKSLDTSQFPVTFANTFKDFNREYNRMGREDDDLGKHINSPLQTFGLNFSIRYLLLLNFL